MYRIKRMMYGILAGILLLQLAGCEMPLGKNGQKETENLHGGEEAGAREQTKQGYDRSAAVTLDVDIDFSALGIEYYDDAVELYQDQELSNKVYCEYEWNRGERRLSLLPPVHPLLNVSTLFASKAFLRKYEHSDYFLFEKGENRDWGNLGRMYLVRWLDLQTGEKLDKPEITEIEIEGELDRPKNFQFEVSEYGNGILSWEPVEDAECYLVVEATYLTGDDEISGFYESCDIVAETEETTWQPEDTGDIMNREFQMYTVEEEDREYYYGVIAVGKAGTSMVSPLIPKKEMAEKLPFCEEENGYEGEFGATRFAQSIDLLSRYQWIQLCDGTMAQRLLQYKIDDAELVNVDDGDGVKEMLQLPYTVVGTEFEGSFYVETFDRKTYQEDLENLQKRQDILKSKMTGLLRDVEVEVRPEKSTDEDIRENQDVPAAGNHSSGDGLEEGLENMLDNPMGTTKLSRYLAACLLERDEYIAVSDIQEIPDREGLMDAFYEAYYQNPLIPAVREISVLESGEALSVIYEEDIETGRKKQRQVMEQVEFVARELEEEGMTDLDKVLAVNSYLCDTVTYDTMSPIEAGQSLMTCTGISELHYSEAMAGQSADEVFTDSMTPFGALVNHKGVCLAYAGAFQLLARAMGLDSIVVTGTLNGNQNHAWNKVKIDGKWCVVDVTSNDDQDMDNSMLNVSDKVAELVLKENDHYLCDDSIGQYFADTDEFEYYHLSGKDYEKDKIAEAFVHELTLGKKAVLRTDATLTNAEFQSIVKEVMDDMDQIEMQGYYRLGVVYLERKVRVGSRNEKDDSQKSDLLTPKKQIDIFADEAGEWGRNFDRSSNFTVADLNQDGRLELITDVIQGSGHFAYNHYFTVDKAGTLTELQSDRSGEYLSTYYDSEDGLIHVPVYYDEKRDVYYSIQGGGNVDRPSISFVYYLDSVSIENGGVRQETLAYQICEREDAYADFSYRYEDSNGKEITEEKFRTIAERKYAGLKNMQMTWKWQNISKEELDAMSKEELEELLMDSYQNFKIVDEAG